MNKFYFYMAFICLSILIICGLGLAGTTLEQTGDPRQGIDFAERDYISARNRSFHGTNPVVGQVYMISATKRSLPDHFTFQMNKMSALFVDMYPLEQPVSVIMYASAPTALRALRPVWTNNDLRYNVRFWTDRYWFPLEKCNTNNCAKIQFKVIRGSMEFVIIDARHYGKALVMESDLTP